MAQLIDAPRSTPTAADLAAAVEGDKVAVDAFVAWAWPVCFRVAFFITHDEQAAADVSQEAVLSSVSSIGRLDQTRSPRSWVERIAANKSIDWIRKQRSLREDPIPASHELQQEFAVEDDVTEAVRGALSEEVIEALGALDLGQRTAVVLRHLLDYSPSEISSMTGVPAATVRTRLHRGLSKLRDQLSNERGGGR